MGSRGIWSLDCGCVERDQAMQSRVWVDVAANGFVKCANEADLAVLVSGLLRDLIKAMGLNAKVLSEVGTFVVRTDLWVLTLFGTQLGW